MTKCKLIAICAVIAFVVVGPKAAADDAELSEIDELRQNVSALWAEVSLLREEVSNHHHGGHLETDHDRIVMDVGVMQHEQHIHHDHTEEEAKLIHPYHQLHHSHDALAHINSDHNHDSSPHSTQDEHDEHYFHKVDDHDHGDHSHDHGDHDNEISGHVHLIKVNFVEHDHSHDNEEHNHTGHAHEVHSHDGDDDGHDHHHDHGHEHEHDHGHEHEHDHAHDHDHDHAHDHDHTHDHDHDHAHEHSHASDESHDHEHYHDHDHSDEGHDHNNSQDNQNNHDDHHISNLDVTHPLHPRNLEDVAKATCDLKPNSAGASSAVEGSIVITQKKGGEGPVFFDLSISGFPVNGLSEAHVGFHIHERPVDKSGDCASAGGHFNPHGTVHGGPTDEIRHTGDLGNIVVPADGRLDGYIIVDHKVAFSGDDNIVGKSIVVHAGEDDLGTGGDAGSQATGNAGGRLACCNIYLAPAPRFRFGG